MAGAVAFDKATREALARALVRRLKDEFGADLDPMDGHRLIEVLSESLGAYWYNQGLYDAEAVLRDRADTLAEAVAGLEKPVPVRP